MRRRDIKKNSKHGCSLNKLASMQDTANRKSAYNRLLRMFQDPKLPQDSYMEEFRATYKPRPTKCIKHKME